MTVRARHACQEHVAEKAQRGLEAYALRDGRLIERLAHHRRSWRRAKFDHFVPLRHVAEGAR